MKNLIKSIASLFAIVCILAFVACDQPSGPYEVTYTFTESVRKVGTTKITIDNVETEYDIVEFGDWPQTIKADNVKVNKRQLITRGAYTYYVGSDGNYYAKVVENANSTDYFKVEPIKWRVLTKNYNNTNKALLLAEKILTANGPFYENIYNNRNIENKTIYPNNYEHSQVRAYLNGLEYQFAPFDEEAYKNKTNVSTHTVSTHKDKGFLQTAFTTEAQAKIEITTVDNSADSTTDSTSETEKAEKYACNNTNDKIFLLSEKEVTTADYGFDKYNMSGTGNSRIKVATDFAFYFYKDWKKSGELFWWLRSPRYYSGEYACVVQDNGLADYVVTVIYTCDNVDEAYIGLVPALSILYE